MWAWGQNANGQLCDGTTGPRTTPVPVNTGEVWTQVSAGQGQHAMAIRADGTLWAWGRGSSGELGMGTTTTVQATKVQVAPAPRGGGLRGSTTTRWRCARTVRCGRGAANYRGQLGRNDTTPSAVPVQVGTDNTWVSIAAGDIDDLRRQERRVDVGVRLRRHGPARHQRGARLPEGPGGVPRRERLQDGRGRSDDRRRDQDSTAAWRCGATTTTESAAHSAGRTSSSRRP